MAAANKPRSDNEMLDVLIIGAGISGIGTACHLERECPGKRYAILDRRQDMGGTWDLFRYPGIRSDSDVFTFAFKFRPWKRTEILADGDKIKAYLKETAREYGVADHVRFGLKVSRANWSSEQRCWEVTALHEPSGQLQTFRSRFLIMGTGYYKYDHGYTPEIPGLDQFGGEVIHPQNWPEGLDYSGKKVVVIGSGATAVTLVPAMAEKAGHITMLQRSPSYIFSVPQNDELSKQLKKVFSDETVYELARKRHILLYRLIWNTSKRFPALMRKILLGAVRKQVGRDQMHHFTPDYQPWDERLCAVPGNDLFKAMNSGKASVVTDHIDKVDEAGIQLKSGQRLDADIIITATGLELQIMGGADMQVDGESQDLSRLMMYKASMVENLPNFSWIMGYVNYPWTLKADIVAGYMCRLINHMDEHGHDVAVALDQTGCRTDGPFLDQLDSGYIKRSKHLMPRQGERAPWKVTSDYPSDRELLLEGRIDDGVLQFDPESHAGSDAAPALKMAASG
ncbi:MAG: FAD-containing monooxygenase EthA [Salinisphaeraceae bacterium]|nr:FAD-containing monooxygenase EthA [Salinisphaeraceae bacterium]